jgi:hypothetical protein
VGTVAPLNDRNQGGQEGADEPTAEPLIEAAQNGCEEAGKLMGEALRRKLSGLRGAG